MYHCCSCVCVSVDEGCAGCRVRSPLQDKDRLLLRSGEDGVGTEEEEEESKTPSTIRSNTVLVVDIVRSHLPLASGQFVTDVKYTDLPDHTTAGETRIYFPSISTEKHLQI